jgi:hypothetical protein
MGLEKSTTFPLLTWSLRKDVKPCHRYKTYEYYPKAKKDEKSKYIAYKLPSFKIIYHNTHTYFIL